MKFHPCLSLSVLTLLGPGVAAAAAVPSHAASRAAIVSAEEAADLKEHSFADLVSLRAGGVDRPASIAAAERSALCAAQAKNGGLENLRAGGGAETTLLVLVVVLLILVLI